MICPGCGGYHDGPQHPPANLPANLPADEFIDGIEACLYDDTAGNVAWLIAELRRAREVFRDLLTANSSHDEEWVKGRARFGLGDS